MEAKYSEENKGRNNGNRINNYIKTSVEMNRISSFNTEFQFYPHILEFNNFSLESKAQAEINKFLNLIKNGSSNIDKTKLKESIANVELPLPEPRRQIYNEIKAISKQSNNKEAEESVCLFQNSSDPNIEPLVYECSEGSLPNLAQLEKPNNSIDGELKVVKYFSGSVSSGNINETNDNKTVNNFIFFDSYTEIKSSVSKTGGDAAILPSHCDETAEYLKKMQTCSDVSVNDEILNRCSTISEHKDSFTATDNPDADIMHKTINMLYEVIVRRGDNRTDKNVTINPEKVKKGKNVNRKTKLIDRGIVTETIRNIKSSKNSEPKVSTETNNHSTASKYYNLIKKISKTVIDRFPYQTMEIYETNGGDSEEYFSADTDVEDAPIVCLKKIGLLKESLEEAKGFTTKKQPMILKSEETFKSPSRDTNESSTIHSTSFRSLESIHSSGFDERKESKKFCKDHNLKKQKEKVKNRSKPSDTTKTDRICNTKNEKDLKSNKITLDNGEPAILFNKCGYPLTDLKGRKLKNNLGTELLSVNSLKELLNSKLPVYDSYNVCINDDDFHPEKIMNFNENVVKILGNNDEPIKLFNSLGYPLNDEDGYLLNDFQGRPLVILDSSGAPICCKNSEPIYVEDGSLWVSVRDNCYVINYGRRNPLVNENNQLISLKKEETKPNLPENGIQISTFNDTPIRLYSASGYPLTDLNGFLSKDSQGKLLVILDSSGAPTCCTNCEPIYIEDGSSWVSVRDNYKVIHYGKRNNNYFCRKLSLQDRIPIYTNPLLSLVEENYKNNGMESFSSEIIDNFEYNEAFYLNTEQDYLHKNDTESSDITETSEYNLLDHEDEGYDYYNYLCLTSGMEIMLPENDHRDLKVWTSNRRRYSIQ